MTEPVTRRQTVEYFLQTGQPDDSWESSSSFMDALDWAEQRLAVRREKYPEFEHRLARRTTTVVVELVADAAPAAARSAPADRAELRDRIADTLAATDGWRWVSDSDKARSSTYQGYQTRADAVLAVLPEPADRYRTAWLSARGRAQAYGEGILRHVADRDWWKREAHAVQARAVPADRAALSDTERQFLTFALDQAAEEMSLGDGFTAEDQAALEKLRRMADEAQQQGGATPEETLALADGPVRCPLCPYPVTLHTPNGARAHFTAIHPEQRLTGRGTGPWPQLVTIGAEAQQPETQGGDEPFGTGDCTCIPFVREGGTARYCRPGDTVDQISGWEPGLDCPHHRQPAAVSQPGKEA